MVEQIAPKQNIINKSFKAAKAMLLSSKLEIWTKSDIWVNKIPTGTPRINIKNAASILYSKRKIVVMTKRKRNSNNNGQKTFGSSKLVNCWPPIRNIDNKETAIKQ